MDIGTGNGRCRLFFLFDSALLSQSRREGVDGCLALALDVRSLAFLHDVPPRQRDRDDSSVRPHRSGCLSLAPPRQRSGKVVRVTGSFGVVGEGTISTSSRRSGVASSIGEAGNGSGIPDRKLWFVTQACSGPIQFGILPVENSHTNRAISALPIPAFY